MLNWRSREVHPAQAVVRQWKRLIRREAAEHYLFLTLLSFAASVSITRLFLSLAGYPQIGGGELHIAHVLWGGLLLYAAALLPLLFANRAVYRAGSLLAGAGVGLFIDEVGKFITQKNDYFFPVSASIIYVLFLLTILLFVHVRRTAKTNTGNTLSGTFEDAWEALHHPLTPRQYERLRARLAEAAKSAPSRGQASLAEALLAFLDMDGAPLPSAADEARQTFSWSRRALGRLTSRGSLRVCLIIGMWAIGLLTLKNPICVVLGAWWPGNLAVWLANLHMGRQIEASIASPWFSARLGLEVFIGFTLLVSGALLATKRDRSGTTAGYLGLLLSLTTMDVLLFYFEQFSTIITTGIQFLLLVGIAVFRRHAA